MSIWRYKGFRPVIFDSNYAINDYPLWVNACGEDFILMDEEFCVDRPNGRNDYQMLYIKEGFGHFLINGKMQKVNAPSIVIYKPKEHQKYIYEQNKKADIFWIHFSGSMVEEYLNKYRINHHLLRLGTDFVLFETCVNRMLVTLQTEFAADMCCALFHTLLIDISNMYSEAKNHSPHTNSSKDMLLVIYELMQRTFSENYAIKYYADMCDLSEIYFIKIFREKFNTTPRQFINSLRINKASQLLLETSLTVQAIADSVGFENPFYFSRLFRNTTSMTPSEFRKRSHKS